MIIIIIVMIIITIIIIIICASWQILHFLCALWTDFSYVFLTLFTYTEHDVLCNSKEKKDDKNNNPTSWSCVVLMGGSASERSLVIFSATIAGSESCSKEVTKRKENNTNTAQLVQINNTLLTILNLRACEETFFSTVREQFWCCMMAQQLCLSTPRTRFSKIK